MENNTNLYNPNTGQKLNSGETVYNQNTGQKVVQGTQFSLPSNLNTVDASKINNSNITTPNIPNATYGGLPGAMEADIKNTQKTTDQLNAEALKTKTDTSLNDYTKAIIDSGKISSTVDYTSADNAKKTVDSLNSQIDSEATATRRSIEALQQNNPEGLGTVGMSAKINDIQRNSLSKQADLALLKSAAVNDYDTAATIADRQVAMKTEESNAKLNALKLFYDNNKSDLTKAQDRLYTEKIAQQERDLKKQTDAENAIKDIKLAAVKGGANASVLNKLSSIDATDKKAFDDALALATPYLGDNQVVKLENGNTIMVNAQGKQIASFGGAKSSSKSNNFAFTSDMIKNNYGNDLVSTIASTIKNSGAKQSQSTNDAINVISGLQALVKDNPDGKFVGINPLIRLPNKLSSEEALTNRSNIEAINLKVQQWASGAALTDQQTAKVEKMTPNIGDTDKQVRSKVNALANYMVSQVSGQLAGQGVGFSVDKVDMFTKTPEQELSELYKNPTTKANIEKAIALYPNATDAEILQIVK